MMQNQKSYTLEFKRQIVDLYHARENSYSQKINCLFDGIGLMSILWTKKVENLCCFF